MEFSKIIKLLFYPMVYINGLIVNQNCPNIKAVTNFMYPSNNSTIYWKIFHHLPTVEETFVHPLYLSGKKPLGCAAYFIESTGLEGKYYLHLRAVENKKLVEFRMNKTDIAANRHEYTLIYDNVITDTCSKTLIKHMKLVAAKENYYLVYWICENQPNGSSLQAIVVLVKENAWLNIDDEKFIMKTINKTIKDFFKERNEVLFCDLSILDIYPKECLLAENIPNEPFKVDASMESQTVESETGTEIETRKLNQSNILSNFFFIILILILIMICVEDFLS